MTNCKCKYLPGDREALLDRLVRINNRIDSLCQAEPGDPVLDAMVDELEEEASILRVIKALIGGN